MLLFPLKMSFVTLVQMSNYRIMVLQILSHPFTMLIKWFFRIRVIHKNRIPPQKGCLFISTHESKLDPFYVLSFYGFWNSVVNVPYRFPVLHEYMQKGMLTKIITWFGGYDIGETLEEKAKMLFYTRKILSSFGGVVIFPEARLVKGGHLFTDFQKGYQFLTMEGIQIILVKFDGIHSLWRNFFSKKRPSVTYYTLPSSMTKEEVEKEIQTFYSS